MSDIKAQINELKNLLKLYTEGDPIATDATIRASALDLVLDLDNLEFDEEWEWGEKNGAGEMEPGDSRQWFHEKDMDGHRKVYTFTGPWEPWSWAQERPDLVVPPVVKAKKSVEQAEREVALAQVKLDKAKQEFRDAINERPDTDRDRHRTQGYNSRSVSGGRDHG